MHALLRELNIIISGFMGTGKSAVGRTLAERLGLPFVDMDQVIEERQGCAISEIFAARGEAFFREQESILAAELAASPGRVIATGGGVLASAWNRETLATTGVIFNLNCEPAEILRRLRDANDRPLLQGHDRLARITALLEERQRAYSEAHFQIDTTLLSVEQVVDRIVAICQEQGYCADVFPVTFPLGTYDVWYGDGLVRHTGEILRRGGISSGRIAVVSNRQVLRHHGDALLGSLRRADFIADVIVIPDGEEHKTLRTVRRLYDRFIDLGLDRTATIMALGGGVVGDIAGFAAATFMRGLPFIQVPTTLLAQIDSSIGGKVGVDHPRGKNLVGAFYPAKVIITDPGVLATLPPEQLRAGLGEVIKHGAIGSPWLFEHLERTGTSQLDPAIREAVRIKVDVVGEDPFEQGIRAILNFGHTFGHAFEAVSNFSVLHGEAVGLGMIAAAKVAVKTSLCSSDVEERLVGLLKQVGLPATSNLASPEAIIKAMGTDKKRQQGKLRYVLPRRIGEVIVTSDVPEPAIREALGEVFSG